MEATKIPESLKLIVNEYGHDPGLNTLILQTAITAFSALAPSARMKDVDGNLVTMDLFLVVIRKAGTGKAVIKLARDLYKDIQHHYYTLYQNELAANKGLKLPPPFPYLPVLASDITKARLIEHFMGQQEQGTPLLLFETELDTLFVSTRSDFGGFKSELRKAYHHEPITSSKKSNNTYYHVTEPKLAIIVSGTPDQAIRFFHHSKDGLYSRFMMHYSLESPEWRTYTDVEKKHKMLDMGKLGFEYYMFFLERNVYVDVSIGYEFANTFGQSQFEKFDEEEVAQITRHVFMFFRILGTLACIRAFDERDVSGTIYANLDDLDIAREMMLESFNASDAFLNLLPGNNAVNLNGELSDDEVFSLLNDEFTTPQVFDKLKTYNAIKSARTAQRLVAKWLEEGLAHKLEKAKYKKGARLLQHPDAE